MYLGCGEAAEQADAPDEVRDGKRNPRPSQLIWNDPCQASPSLVVAVSFSSQAPLPLGLSSRGAGVGGESRTLRRRVTLICADYATAPCGAVTQSRMTVLRREVTLSDRASQGSAAALSQSCDACPLDRACLHPPTPTPQVNLWYCRCGTAVVQWLWTATTAPAAARPIRSR